MSAIAGTLRTNLIKAKISVPSADDIKKAVTAQIQVAAPAASAAQNISAAVSFAASGPGPRQLNSFLDRTSKPSPPPLAYEKAISLPSHLDECEAKAGQ